MRLELAFSASYLFDYAFTGVMLLTNDRWVDLAHLLFIPFIGVNGYLLLRAIMFPLALFAFRLAKVETRGMPVLIALTALYTAVNVYNLACWLFFFAK